VYSGEWKGSEIDGQHNWIRFYLLEKVGSMNYYGYDSHDGVTRSKERDNITIIYSGPNRHLPIQLVGPFEADWRLLDWDQSRIRFLTLHCLRADCARGESLQVRHRRLPLECHILQTGLRRRRMHLYHLSRKLNYCCS
jgi:hypothetical protein